ncbi:hypothetical protein [Deinococcus alpinitundrae]|uniref:hypothetical protein n=1 Tax=Deinococcus alpinitundrae TaxID=468913 RepID=UPI001ED91F60|nr:hypothetical protein [Deinococcus alpinitundrae]
MTLPEVLPPKPPEKSFENSPPVTPTLAQPLGLILGCVLALLVGGFTLLLTTFKPPSSQILGGLGIFLLMPALLFPSACCVTTNDSWLPGIFSALGELARLLLTGTVLLIPPRLAYW